MITKSQATSKFKNPCQKAVWVPRHPLVPGYKNLSSRTFWVVQLIPIYFVGLGRTEKIIIWNLVWIRNPCVQLCRVYRKPKIRSPPGWIPKKSPNYHIPNACYMFNSNPGRVVNLESVCEISMLLPTYYLPWSFGNVQSCRLLLCVQLWLKNSNFPLLATSRGRCQFKNSKISKQKLHTKSKKSAKLLLHLLPNRWFGYLCLERVFHPQLIIITVVDLYYKIFSWV